MTGTWREITVQGRTCRISGDPDDIYFHNIVRAVPTLDRLGAVARAALPEDGVVADVGANIGLSALVMAPCVPRGRIHAFEPVPAAFAFLQANAAADPLANIEPNPRSLGAAPGSVAIHVGPRFTAGSHVVDPSHLMAEQIETIAVPLGTLDGFVAERGLVRLDLVKIDVEGFEAEVLAGAARSLERFRPVVVLEVNSFCLVAFRDSSPRRFVEALIDHFPYVIWFARDGAPVRLLRGPPLHRFIHDHLALNRSVDDLVCCYDDAWLARMRAPG